MSQSIGVLEEMTRQLSVEIPRVIDRGLENLRNSDERRTMEVALVEADLVEAIYISLTSLKMNFFVPR